MPRITGEQTRHEILAFFVQFKREHDGNSPMLREIFLGTQSSKSYIYYPMQVLQETRAIKWEGTRQIRVNPVVREIMKLNCPQKAS